ncbi:alpha/beta hydrolase [Lysinibacillus antri]|uniref:Alpha/beta hydrolase n=1 Tax=Lysinibacillus antri TaxID=2498145 RepID=A0A432L9H8_9BACI|nr:alpha/beta hydrolase [Lysinibacillus antri]RUL49609.1 alpha/beta hydrolase [Lysinibacillus antri]
MKRWLVICLTAIALLAGCSSTQENNSKKQEEQTVNTQFLGEWTGTIEVPQSPLVINISLEEAKGTFSVPIQGLKNFPIETLRYNGDTVDITVNVQGQKMVIKGTLADGKIEGTFTQSGATFPVTFIPNDGSDAEEVTYKEVSIPVKDGELKVALQPAANGEPSPVAIIIAGSGPTDKNGNSTLGLSNNSLKMLAEQLAENNIATIRYDKRGLGDNTALVKNPTDVTIDTFANDVASIIAYVKAQPSFTSVHVIGHSEGALLGTLAAQDEAVDTLTLIAGTGRAIDEVLIEQLSAQVSPALLEESKEIISKIKNGEIVEEISNDLQMMFAVPNQPYLASWIKYNPTEELKQLNNPTLIIQGTTDLQTNEKDAETLGTAATELVYIEGMNHVLKEAPQDRAANFATYSDPSLPLHEELLPLIEKFIKNK